MIVLKNMEIIILNDNAVIAGGAAEVAINTAVLLSNAGYRVNFFSTGDKVDERLLKSEVAVHLTGQKDCIDNENILKGASQGLWNRKAKKELELLIENAKEKQLVALIHSFTKALSPSIFRCLRDKNIPTVLVAHDSFLVCPSGGFTDYKRGQICKRRPMSFGCLACNCDKRNYFQKIYRCIRFLIQSREICKLKFEVAYVSLFCRETILRNNPSFDEGYVLPNYIEIGDFQFVESWKNKKFGYIGRVSSEKGTQLFCEAVRKAGAKGIVIGDGPIKGELEQKYPEIEFCGWVDRNQYGLYLQNVRACVFPSICLEASPLTPIEVMSTFGIPFIVSDGCAARDDIRNNITGLLFTAGDVDSLVECIHMMEDDEFVRSLSLNLQDENHQKVPYTKEDYLNNVLYILEQALLSTR